MKALENLPHNNNDFCSVFFFSPRNEHLTCLVWMCLLYFREAREVIIIKARACSSLFLLSFISLIRIFLPYRILKNKTKQEEQYFLLFLFIFFFETNSTVTIRNKPWVRLRHNQLNVHIYIYFLMGFAKEKFSFSSSLQLLLYFKSWKKTIIVKKFKVYVSLT